ncbi:nucleotidyl transferase AbiEii/AbiGii toxin family protein [Nakamurella flava]|uniref:Nucleotidyl transferase AbiEii/AbiGii toxin family protein n=1 Tax=Nakamurella flava TaxID=2576308 RepID=A0A4U6QBP0_9ACTN|nr:nucleotidyl transferase AbiEii/AbiGii toxin family protein [Nakamurella flava]TKV57401.1 nucleotidyl transferase AbiEii/AbiGii toxin family protein [Nakamurella flava]
MTGKAYPTPAAFRRALTDRTKQASTASGRPFQELRRLFVLHCFLARVFDIPGERWILKGGTSLAVQLPNARFSRDLDLLNTAADLTIDGCITELKEAGRAQGRDPFIFDVSERGRLTGATHGVTLTVRALLGSTVFEQFPLDLTTGLHFTGKVRVLHSDFPVSIDDVGPPPPMRLYPVVDQVADKVAAMYEQHNGRTSGRYRDLVDLVLIIGADDITIDPEQLGAALRREQRRRGMTLPRKLVPPGPDWQQKYTLEAMRSPVPTSLRSLTRSLEFAGQTIDPVLARFHDGDHRIDGR